MNDFEIIIERIARIKNKAQAIKIHRDFLFAERFTNNNDCEDLLPSVHMIHDDDVIYHFRKDPEFAELYLQAAKADGFAEEIFLIQKWYKSAKVLGPIKRRVLRKV